MRTCIILNPNAGTAKNAGALEEAIAGRDDIVMRVSQSRGDATRLAAEALEEGFERILSAGGDGTSNEVVNGLAADFSRAIFGVIPLGTGNDLPRTLAIPPDPVQALGLLETGQVRTVDLIRVETGPQTTYCINVAAGGFSGAVDEILTDEMKASWGPLAYLRGALKALPDMTKYQTSITYDDD